MVARETEGARPQFGAKVDLAVRSRKIEIG